MPRYKLILEYHGGPFAGWQRQAADPSVQQTVEDALRKLDPATPSIVAAGRTDAGVHALGQVAHCDVARELTPFRLMEAVNFHLRPAPIAVVAAEIAAPDFSARFNATARQYRYRIVNRRARLAVERGLAWRVATPLDTAAMREAGAHLLGRHDFTTFRAAQCQAKSPVKSLDSLEIERQGEEIIFTVRARSFLHNQVRSFVGTLERVGAGAWAPGEVKRALEARRRAACGPVAPPYGLYLERVFY